MYTSIIHIKKSTSTSTSTNKNTNQKTTYTSTSTYTSTYTSTSILTSTSSYKKKIPIKKLGLFILNCGSALFGHYLILTFFCLYIMYWLLSHDYFLCLLNYIITLQY